MSVFVNGCWDLLHAGHIHFLRGAARLGTLTVGVNSDAGVRRLKGPGRPVVPEAERVELLEALRCVARVEVFEADTPAALVRWLRPAVLVKGEEHRGVPLPEVEIVMGYGGRVVYLPRALPLSTTALIRAARAGSRGLYVVVEVEVRVDRLQDFLELVKSHAAASQREPGCLRFDVLQRSVVPCEFMLVEAWADQSALEAHQQTPHYARWRREIGGLEAVPRTHREFTAL